MKKFGPKITLLAGWMAAAWSLLSPISAVGLTTYRDAQENLYIDGVRKDDFLTMNYSGSTASAKNRYQSVWMYRKPNTCPIHTLWRNKKKLLLGSMTIVAGNNGADIPFQTVGTTPTSIPYSANNNPCTGATINPAIPWKTLAGGVKGYYTTDPCRSTYKNRYSGANSCIPSQVVYLSGLSGAAYLVKSSTPKNRFVKSNGCGFLKIPNSPEWKAYANDSFLLFYRYSGSNPDYAYLGVFTRSTMPIKPFNQVPKCFDGKKFLPAP